ncbi:NAD-dependent protein deacetylase sirtuin-2 [Neocloeon triangulifer]|uniref:NAD-dependent protein deacetylase sirtuin-2 n=1 Tax=Neocloeon triangulifer TaxID=2078957 RepID=UPI00286F449B|nr:NAD-dependent protein deacetylase sirtuin-2 [Neocloeon triangulifer]
MIRITKASFLRRVGVSKFSDINYTLRGLKLRKRIMDAAEKPKEDKEEPGTPAVASKLVPENADAAKTASKSETASEDETPEETKEEGTEGTEAAGSSKNSDIVDSISHYLKEKLHLSSDKPDKKKILHEKSIDGIVKYIEERKVTKIVTMAGAGISTSAGIPDFRSPVTGLYNNLAKYNLPHPHAIFELDFFIENPKPFFVLAKELYPGSFKPTISHYFVKLLCDKGLLQRHYTQNIDTLERVSGLPGEKIVEAHGTFYMSHCLQCELGYEQDWMKEQIFADEIPKCISCGGIVKPDIVFFGENLPTRFFQCLEKDFDECELLIIMGSSLEVQPFASLIDRVDKKVPRLLINREKAGAANPLMRALGLGSAGLDFSSDNHRDVAWLGDCDAGCEALAKALGWDHELRELLQNDHERIDKEEAESKQNASKRK